MNLVNSQKKILIASFLIVPFLSAMEVVSLFTGDLNSQTQNLTGIFKFSKDIFLMLNILLGFILVMRRGSINKGSLILLSGIMFVVMPSILLSFFDSNNVMALASGIRWLLPIVLIFFIYNAVDAELIEHLAKVLIVLFLIHFVLQWLQAFFAGGWYGVNALGLNSRNPGMFLIPNTASFFTLGVLLFVLFVSNVTLFQKNVIVVLSFISVLLTLSGTGFVMYFFIVALYFFKRSMIIYFPLFALILVAVALGSLSFFEARGDDYINESGGVRLNILTNAIENAGVLSSNFGLGTNTYLLITNEGSVMDSLYASIAVNLGISGLALCFLIIFYALIICSYSLNKSFFSFVVFFGIYGATTILFEVYPLNVLFGVMAIFYSKRFSGVLR